MFTREERRRIRGGVDAKSYVFVFEWFDGDPASSTTKCLGFAGGGMRKAKLRKSGKLTSIARTLKSYTIAAPPPFVQCFLRHRVQPDLCACVYRGPLKRHTAEHAKCKYKRAKPWIKDPTGLFKDVRTQVTYKSKSLQVHFEDHPNDGYADGLRPSKICCLLEDHLGYVPSLIV